MCLNQIPAFFIKSSDCIRPERLYRSRIISLSPVPQGIVFPRSQQVRTIR